VSDTFFGGLSTRPARVTLVVMRRPVRLRPSRSTALLLLAAALLRLGPAAAAPGSDYASCVSRTQRAPEEALTEAQAWRDQGGGLAARHCLALALVALRRYSDAAKELEALAGDVADKNEATRIGVLGQAGNAWLLAGRPERARPLFAAAIALSPDDPDLRIDRARAAGSLGDFDAALSDLDYAFAVDPERDDALALRASARRRLGDRERALEDAEMALIINPNNTGALLERGILRFLAGDTDGARADWRRLIEAAPGTPAADAARANLKKLDRGRE